MFFVLFMNRFPTVFAKEKKETKWSNVNAASSGIIKHASTFLMICPRRDLFAIIARFSMSSKEKQWIKYAEEGSNAMYPK